MSEKVAMTPGSEIEWLKFELDGGILYSSLDLEEASTVADITDDNVTNGLRCIGEGERKDNKAAKVFKKGDKAIRETATGIAFHSELAWVQANLMLAKALESSKEAQQLRIKSPQYIAFYLGKSSSRSLMSFEGFGRRHPRKTGDETAFERGREAAEVASQAFIARWGKHLPIFLDFRASNILVGTEDVVLLDVDPLAGWNTLGI